MYRDHQRHNNIQRPHPPERKVGSLRLSVTTANLPPYFWSVLLVAICDQEYGAERRRLWTLDPTARATSELELIVSEKIARRCPGLQDSIGSSSTD